MTATALRFEDSQPRPQQAARVIQAMNPSREIQSSIKVIVQDQQEMAIAQNMNFPLLPQVGDLIWVRGAKYICVDTKREFFDHNECFYLAIVKLA